MESPLKGRSHCPFVPFEPAGRAGEIVQFVIVVPPALREEGVILIAFCASPEVPVEAE
jgi:hypothetical protein